MGPPVVFNEQPIDQSETYDLATFDMTQLLPVCGQRKFYRVYQDAPRKLHKGDKLVAVGNPGMHRKTLEIGLLTGATTYGIEVSSVDGLRFHADISAANVQHSVPPARKPERSAHAGISGSPCFLYREARPSILVGFVTREFLKYLEFLHVSCINPDGTLKK